MKVKELLAKFNADEILPYLGIWHVVDVDRKKLRTRFRKAYRRLISAEDNDNSYLIYAMHGHFYEIPTKDATETFMFDKDAVKQYKMYPRLEKYMMGDEQRNRAIEHFDIKKIDSLIEETPLPEFYDISLISWNKILNAEIEPGCLQYEKPLIVAACIVDLMMQFDTDEHKSHYLVKQADQHIPFSSDEQKRRKLARHLYHYRVLQTLSHKEGL